MILRLLLIMLRSWSENTKGERKSRIQK